MVNAEYLQTHALFGGVASEDMAAIIPLLKEEQFAAGDYVVREGDEGSRMYFIRHGSVEVVKNADGEPGERQLAVLREGDTFGEMELIDIQNRSASIKALEALTVLSLGNEDMYEIFEHNQAAFIIILMNIAREISRRLRRMDTLFASSLFTDAGNSSS